MDILVLMARQVIECKVIFNGEYHRVCILLCHKNHAVTVITIADLLVCSDGYGS